jgi:diguanylate cyclase (GGDEF)-like protein
VATINPESPEGYERHLAWSDPLTGCWNRRFFDEALEEMIEKMEQWPAPLSVSYVDLDDLKRLNDVMGHVAGDQALAEVARVPPFAYPERSPVSRVGGDEFINECLLVLSSDSEASLS